MTEPCAFVFRSVDGVPVIAMFVDVACARVVFPLNVFVPENVLFVYVFPIVDEALMYALAVLFKNVVSSVRAPDELVRPEPNRELNDEPLTIRFVVDAVLNEEYIVDEE